MNKRIGSDDRYTDAPPEIAEALAASGPVEDDFPSPEELARQLGRTITIRLDPAVYEWFKRPGPGYQTRINAVLRYYVHTQKAKAGHSETGQTVSPSETKSPVARRAAPREPSSAMARRRSSKGKTNGAVRKAAKKTKHTARR
ncbi:MAG: BrnA antitoxin family protein [Spirochaetia bacterium]|jgi:uncharacterized protein (DUF4415 family)